MVGKCLRVFIVERVHATADRFAQKLTSAGHEVETASEVAEAFTWACLSHFDVALIDLSLRGFELAARIRNGAVSRNAVLIAVATQTDDTHRSRSISAGFDYYITKPVRDSVLLAFLQKACSHSLVRKQEMVPTLSTSR